MIKPAEKADSLRPRLAEMIDLRHLFSALAGCLQSTLIEVLDFTRQTYRR